MKYILIWCLFLSSLTSLKAQTIKDVILSIPDEVVVGLTVEQKEELSTDSSSDTVTVDNVLNGQIKRLAISADYVNLQTSEVATTQIKILPLVNDSKILCVVKTQCSDACDSRILFYSLDWKLLAVQNFLPQRSFSWFIKRDADRESADYKEAIKAVDMNPMVFNLSSNDYTLKVDSDIANYISSEDLADLTPFMTGKSKIFVWNKISFKEKKD